jgi:Bifunctional DNA primase/polymerase, N-terminal
MSVAQTELPVILQEAIRLINLDWYVFPVHGINPAGDCTCGQAPCPHRAGKHPATHRGWKDASNRTAALWNWFRRSNNLNLGVSLAPSGLVVVAPDSLEWLDEFRHYGLPDTAVTQSGGGPGHYHFYYRRPPECPLTRINRSAEYDIQSSGYMVAPPSRHFSGQDYAWINHPESFRNLPLAPKWAVELLNEVTERRQVGELQVKNMPRLSGDHPPAELNEKEMRLWTGTEYIGTDTEVDRSSTLFAIGAALADNGATHEQIIAALANRDTALGYGKYPTRPVEYQRIAIKLLGPMS